MRRLSKLFHLNALTITIVYVVTGILWILFSDQVVLLFVSDLELFSTIESLKGLTYVFVTGGLLFLLIRFSNNANKNKNEAIGKALDTVNIATWSINLNTNENVTSQYHYRLFGLPKKPEKWSLADFYGFIHPDDRQKVKKAFSLSIETEEEYSCEYRILWKDGTTHLIQSRGNLIYNNDKEATHIAGIIADVTQQRKLEESLAKEKEMFERIFEHLPVIVDIYDPDVNDVRVNKAFEKYLGWSNEDLQNIDLMKACYPEPQIRERALQAMADADGKWHEFEVIDKYGDKHIQEWSNIRLSDNKTVGIGLEVTELRATESEIIESRMLFQKMFESLEESVLILDPGTRLITNCNESTCKLFGYSKEELIGDTTEKLYPNNEKFLEFHERSIQDLEKHGVFQTEFMLQKKDGSLFYSNHTVTLVKNEEGEVERVVSVVKDITSQKEYEEEMRQQLEFIDATLEHIPIGVAVNMIDSGDVTLMNAQFSEIYGWPKEILKNVEEFFAHVYPNKRYRDRMIEMTSADIASGNPKRMQWNNIKITTKTGEERIINAKNIPVYDQNLMISTVVDVTAQVEAERKLSESEYNYRLLFQRSPLPMWIYDPKDLRFVEVNNAAVNHYGYSRKEFYEMSIFDIRPKEDRETLKKEVKKGRLTDFSDRSEWRHLKKSGELIHVRISGSSINYFGNNYRLILANDVTEQKKAEEMVLASLVEGENKERARIARELHDGLGQYLAAANMNLDAIKDDLNKLSDRKQEQYRKGLNLLKNAVSETAQISRNLLPRVVDDYGLALAIESMVDSYSSNTNISINYFQNIDSLKLPREVELNLYRIVQEGLSNAIKYSEASEINIQLIKHELDLVLTIDDNGIGFETTSADFNPGLGFQTIKTRAGALGGSFEFDSHPNRGTFLHIMVPL